MMLEMVTLCKDCLALVSTLCHAKWEGNTLSRGSSAVRSRCEAEEPDAVRDAMIRDGDPLVQERYLNTEERICVRRRENIKTSIYKILVCIGIAYGPGNNGARMNSVMMPGRFRPWWC